MLKRFTWLILIIIALIAISMYGQKGESAVGNSVFLKIFAPLQNILTSSISAIDNIWENYFKLVDVKIENAKLKEDIAKQNQEINTLNEYKLTSERLAELLEFKKDNKSLKLIGANVVAWNTGPWLKTIVIDRGSADGLLEGLAVVNSQGALGRVVELSNKYSKVLLLNDYDSSLDAMVQRSRQNVIVAGQGTDLLILKYVSNDSDLRLGDKIISSGYDRFFPAGINLGIVTYIEKKEVEMFMEVEVTPIVNYNTIEEVFVILNHHENFIEKMFKVEDFKKNAL